MAAGGTTGGCECWGEEREQEELEEEEKKKESKKATEFTFQLSLKLLGEARSHT